MFFQLLGIHCQVYVLKQFDELVVYLRECFLMMYCSWFKIELIPLSYMVISMLL